MNDQPKKLILTKKYRDAEMYTCPYCGIVCTPLDFKEDGPWCETGYKCPTCHTDVLPHRTMGKK